MIRAKVLPCRPYRLQRDDKLYFFHIPKTAGTTFAAQLESQFPPPEICPAHLPDQLLQESAENLRRRRLLWGHFGNFLPAHLPGEIIYLTLLREPLSWAISVYQWMRRTQEHVLHEQLSRDCPTLSEFVGHPDYGLLLHNRFLYHLIADARFNPQWSPPPEPSAYLRWAKENDARLHAIPSHLLLEVARARLERFAFVGLAERMDESLRLLAFTFGWGDFGSVPRLNSAPEPIRKEDIPEHTLAALRELTCLDAELYAHAQKLFEERLGEMQRAGSMWQRVLGLGRRAALSAA
jgi:hypothetical protein